MAREISPLTMWRDLFNKRKAIARRRLREWDLSFSEFMELSSKDCFYCATPPSNTYTYKKKAQLKYSGLDRMNNNLGYLKANLVPCCAICNSMKSESTLKVFSEHLSLLASRLHIITKKLA